MKKIKITYWATTSLVALMMTYSAFAYLTQPVVNEAFRHLGYPSYFRIELAIAKLGGAVFLLAPVTARIKEWVYAGFAFVFISAFIAHAASGDPAMARINPLLFLVLLVVSYITYHKMQVGEQAEPGKKAFVYPKEDMTIS
ncbi:MAG TPA: DoxX family protein [Chitinophagaceae bacterium]|nr:DoxX family protein [Chitinophagaceae bacterium]